ncbi:MAG: hypothetical protein Q7R47_02325, partial [Candidatus Diapherotrites archaeon]|nr:hypothetical protein [Candidatus Diapherotrites archaeon]
QTTRSRRRPLRYQFSRGQKFHAPTDMFIYHDTVLLTIWNAEPYFAIRIKNRDVSQIYRDYFELIWKISKK